YTHTELTSGGFSVQEIEATPRLIEGVDRYIIRPAQVDPWVGPITDAVTAPITDLPSQYLNQPLDLGFIDKNGSEFDNVTFTTNWIRDTRNRGQLATAGTFQHLSFEITVPGSDL